jgi:hypothetical protein
MPVNVMKKVGQARIEKCETLELWIRLPLLGFTPRGFALDHGYGLPKALM